jgi:aklavinone 12-hydroxylase
VPVEAVALGRDVEDEGGACARLLGLGETGATLLRPDGFVAWRAAEAPADAAQALGDAVARALARRTG